ncbi:hypothetical protein CKR_0271 [Clostridium kluyveri NBRC 12016]|uniref:Uncharacterized protein n=1 Tax=Clostridium kluyveri (strain NBRC 12016) TaxID=583346 RepID=B9DYJ7_CLOK1|nr:hypothetical protein CKR_0271 [Clostridium kluyveri NBRC 12016]
MHSKQLRLVLGTNTDVEETSTIEYFEAICFSRFSLLAINYNSSISGNIFVTDSTYALPSPDEAPVIIAIDIISSLLFYIF